jgi:hypothetical protein
MTASSPDSQKGPPRASTRAWPAVAATLAGATWAVLQAWFTAVIADIDTSGLACSTGQGNEILVVSTCLAMGAALAGVALQISKRSRHALLAIGLEVVFVAVWIAAGGFDALDCALDA